MASKPACRVGVAAVGSAVHRDDALRVARARLFARLAMGAIAMALWLAATPGAGFAQTGAVRLERFYAGDASPENLVTGADGRVWFTYDHGVGFVAPDGSVTLRPSGDVFLLGLAATPDGALWATHPESHEIMRFTPDGAITRFPLPDGLWPTHITLGPDGNLWFAIDRGLAKMTPTGQVTSYVRLEERDSVWALTAGPDGAVWFAWGRGVGRMTIDGQTQLWTGKDYDMMSIALGPDGNLWSSAVDFDHLLRVTPSGVRTPIFAGPLVSRVTSSRDGKLWFSYQSGVGRVAPDGTALRRWAEPFGGSTDCDSNTPLGVYDGIAFDATGALWASDSARHSLLRLSTRSAAQPSPLEPLVRAEGVFARRDAITRGPDGNVWISAAHAIVRFDAAGRRTVFRRGVASRPGDLLPATDGSVWYTVAQGIDHLTPNGRVHHYRRGLPRRSQLSTLARGPDGNIWFVDHGARAIGRMTRSGHVHEYVRGVPRRADLASIAADRRYLWVTDASGAVLRVSTRGRVRRFTRGLGPKADPFDITRGPDGAMWVTEFAAQRIARITQAGRITTYPVRDDPAGITSGPDGALWFTTASASASDTAAGVGRISTQGAVNQFYAHMTCSGRSRTIATGPDAKLWFIEPDGPVAIGRLSPQRLIDTGALPTPTATPPRR